MSAVLSREELKKKRERYIVPGVKQLYSDPPHLVKGKGQFLYDDEGKEYLDMFAGIVTVSVGHCHPKVTQRTVEQLQTLQHTSTIFMTQPMVDLAEKLAEITPGNLSKTFVTNSGTEANEAAIRMARLASGRHEIIALQHSYHGESHLASSLTANYTLAPRHHAGCRYRSLQPMPIAIAVHSRKLQTIAVWNAPRMLSASSKLKPAASPQ